MPIKIISLKWSNYSIEKSVMCYIQIILSIDIIHLLFISETKNLLISTSHLKYKKIKSFEKCWSEKNSSRF